MARRHVREAEAHAEKQHALVERLRVSSLPTDLATELLQMFEASLDDHRASLQRMLEERRVGLRDGAGRPIPRRPGPDA